MLTLTVDAAEAIKELVVDSALPDRAGLRLAAGLPMNGTGPPVSMSLAPAPEEGDLVVECDGAHVFIEPELAPALEDKRLDGEWQPGGMLFSLEDRR